MGKGFAAGVMIAGGGGAAPTGAPETGGAAGVRGVGGVPETHARGRGPDDPGSEIRLDYRMHLRDSGWQVYDVLIDGVSFVSTYRSQFDRVIQAESYGALVERLRKRNLDTAVVDRKKL